MNTQKADSDIKIAVLGLANAGKTSIILSLTRQFDLISSIKPTHGVNREIIELFGHEMFFWDFGGQDIYRDRYLNSPEMYFNNIAYLFYVIDVQDKFLVDVSLAYFKMIYGFMKKFSPKAEYIIIFHKNDPDFQLKSHNSDVKQIFLNEITPIFKDDGNTFETYSTTILNPQTIIRAFSNPLIRDEGLQRSVTEMIHNFCETYQLSYGVIFTESFLEIGLYSEDEKIDGLLGHFLHNFIEPTEEAPLFEIFYGDVQIITAKFTIAYQGMDMNFYLLIGFREETTIFQKERLERIVADLAENFQRLFQNLDLNKIIKKNLEIHKDSKFV